MTNARVVDGTGAPWFRADVGIRANTISAIGKLTGADARLRIDAAGLVLAPGFIDIHSHSRQAIVRNPAAENTLRQGVTLVVEGNDGSSPVPLAPFFDRLQTLKLGVNYASFVGQGSIRSAVMGLVNRPATPEELDRMRNLTVQAIQDGAFGISTGLFYVPGNFTPTPEIVELAKVIAPFGGMHISHMRDEADKSLDSVRETIRIGEEGGIPTQVTHHKIIGKKNWGVSKDTLRLVEEARTRGVDVTVDQYPYTATSTGTAALFPQWSLEGGAKATVERLHAPEQRARIAAEIKRRILEDRGAGDPKNVVLARCDWDHSLEGKSLADLAATLDGAVEVAMEIQAKGGCSAVYHAADEADLERILKSPYTMVASDGGVQVFGEAVPHPRNYGTFARVLGRYVRERHVIGLEEAVRKMTSFPAARLGLMDRGLVRPGMRADLVIFDPDTVVDMATFEKPHQYAKGVRDVIVNGVLELRNGELTGQFGGQIVRKGK